MESIRIIIQIVKSQFIAWWLVLLVISCASKREYVISIPNSTIHVPAQILTKGPSHHWFGYYDKLEFDPSGRYVLSAQVDFEGRSPKPEDTIRVGYIDLENSNKWHQIGTSVAWGWQQGCMLQFVPGTKSKVIWNDRQGNRFVSHIYDIENGERKILPFPIYTLSPDGRTALSVDFERINDMRPGYGYAGIPDPYKEDLAPDNAGIYRCDLETGEKTLIISLARMNQMPLKPSDDPAFKDFYTEKNWFNHLLFNTDGSRFVFLHRWKSPSKGNLGGFGTLMYSASLDGKDIRIVDGSGYTSHFIWRDPEHLMMWTRHQGKDGFFLFKDDGSDTAVQEGEGIMTRNGHNTYLPGNDWILNDTYPDGDRLQHVYLYHIPTRNRIPIGDFYLDPAYSGEWRCDTHPRSSPDGTKVVIDCPVGQEGRQLIMLDISEMVK
ncbi:MAG: hypothetical protein PVH48_08705 [Cyclobacteriaceae bacterium]